MLEQTLHEILRLPVDYFDVDKTVHGQFIRILWTIHFFTSKFVSIVCLSNLYLFKVSLEKLDKFNINTDMPKYCHVYLELKYNV